MSDEPIRTVDARGALCPMPIVMANRAIAEVAPGALIRLLATDRGSQKDVPAWAEDTGHEVVSTEQADGVFVYLIRKGSD